MLGQIIAVLIILVSLIGGILSLDQPLIGITMMLFGIPFGAYLLDVATKLQSIETDIQNLFSRAKYDSAYLKLLAYSNAAPEELVKLAKSPDLFTNTQLEILAPMVSAMEKTKSKAVPNEAQSEAK
tara:strand:+ start:124 stop:501 length:378 start_codon:yes stop_codon:yes gene_type:complete